MYRYDSLPTLYTNTENKYWHTCCVICLNFKNTRYLHSLSILHSLYHSPSTLDPLLLITLILPLTTLPLPLPIHPLLLPTLPIHSSTHYSRPLTTLRTTHYTLRQCMSLNNPNVFNRQPPKLYLI